MRIYKIENLINGKLYIGQSCKESLDDYWGSGLLIQKAIKRYGVKNFKKEIIEICESKAALNEREIYWIAFFKNQGCVLYNISIGGTGGNLGPEVNQLISRNRTGKHLGVPSGMKGKVSKYRGVPMSEEQKEKLRGPKTLEHRQKLSKSHKGKVLSESHKQSLSKIVVGKANPRSTPIRVHFVDGTIKNYDYITEFLTDQNVSWFLYRKALRGIRVKHLLKIEKL